MSRLPSWYAAAHTRNLAGLVLSRAYRLRAYGAFHLGTEGPLVVVVPDETVLAGLLVQAVAPRPVHVMANDAMSAVLPGGFVRATGTIPVASPAGVDAQHAAREALEDGRAVAVCGARVSAAYLVAVTAAPVAVVTILGAEGRVPTDPPPPRTQIDVYASAPVRIEAGGEPLRATTRQAVEERIRQVTADANEQARRRAGRWENGR